VAACWYGGFTVSAQTGDAVQVATFAGDPDTTGSWEMLLAVQPTSLATKKARALLPESYSKADAIFNVQRASLLVAAFAQGRLDLLATAMQDRLHQPYRAKACPLLKKLLPLVAETEIAGVALSGAGPSVLVFLAAETTVLEAETRIQKLVGPEVELLPLRIGSGVERTLL
jgi:homoserine kinase